MTARARFTAADVEKAMAGAAKAGIIAAVLIQPDGSIAIVPADRLNVTVTANDIDDRIAKFGAR